MTLSLLTALTLAATISTASARADLETTVSLPAGTMVYDVDAVEVTVANVGNRTASNVALTVLLPETNTSPTVHVMGDLGFIDSACTQVGTELQCSLGRIRKGRSVTVDFDLALPWSADALIVGASASTTSSEDSLGNNDDSAAASQTYVDIEIVGPADATNRHCTGTGLSAFYECSLYPSSISSHQITFEDDGTISFVGVPAGYSGEWGQDSDDQLWFEYSYGGGVVASFEGNGVDVSCFEGLTLFPGSSWVAPYEVCLD